MALPAADPLRLGAAVGVAAPPPSLGNLDGAVAALCDDGASLMANCTRSLAGAVPGTHRPQDAVSMGVGNDEAKLESDGTRFYLFYRYGANGEGEVVARRMHYTPNLNVPMVFSEGVKI